MVFFQLGEYRKDAYHCPAKRGGGVEIFIDGYEVHVIGDKLIFNKHEGILLAPGKTVQFIDYYNVNQAGIDVCKHLLKRRAVGIAAGIAAVSVEFYDSDILSPAEGA